MLDEIYKEIELATKPAMIRGAMRLSTSLAGHIAFDDAMQVGRMALWKAIQSYDVNAAKGNIDNFVGRCYRNAYISARTKAVTQRRMPLVHTVVDGETTTRPLPPIPASMVEGIWDWTPDEGWSMNPEKSLERADEYDANERDVDLYLQFVRDQLDERECFIFDTMMDPPDELMEISEKLGGGVNDPPLLIAITTWLDPLLTKSQLDRTMKKIRAAIIWCAEHGGFSDDFRTTVQNGWTSEGCKKRKKRKKK